LRQKPTIVDANFFFDQVVQQLVHPQDCVSVLFRLNGKVVHFFGVILQIEKLQIIVRHDFLQRSRRVEIGWRIIATELVWNNSCTIALLEAVIMGRSSLMLFVLENIAGHWRVLLLSPH
jgi:hypothetical protein